MSIITKIIKQLLGISLIQKRSPRKKKTIKPSGSQKLSSDLIDQKKQAKIYLSQKIQELSSEYNLPFTKLSIRDQKSRRGSCSSKKNISLNRRLYLMPSEISDYVIIHELVHTVHMNHGKEFRAMVENLCSDYKKHVLWLKKNGMNLM